MFIRELLAPNDGAGGGVESGTGGSGDASSPDGGGADFRAALSEELRGDPFVSGAKDLTDFVRQAVNQQHLVGKKGIIPPGEHASDQDRAAFRDQVNPILGVPEAADKYDLGDFKPDERANWSQEQQGAFMEKAHKFGFTQDQMRFALRAHHDHAIQMLEQREAQEAETASKVETTFRQQMGDKAFDKMVEDSRAARALLADALGYGDDDFKTELVDSGLYKNPILVQGLAKMLPLLSEDGALTSGGAGPGAINTPAKAAEEIRRIRAEADGDLKHAYNNHSHPEHDALHKRVAQLYEIKAGGDAA